MASTTKRIAPDEWLRLLAEHAPELRKAGVTRLELEGVKVELAPNDPIIKIEERSDDEGLEALDDPITFPNSRMPRFRRPPQTDDM